MQPIQDANALKFAFQAVEVWVIGDKIACVLRHSTGQDQVIIRIIDAKNP
jgi:hypothetical protein